MGLLAWLDERIALQAKRLQAEEDDKTCEHSYIKGFYTALLLVRRHLTEEHD